MGIDGDVGVVDDDGAPRGVAVGGGGCWFCRLLLRFGVVVIPIPIAVVVVRWVLLFSA